ncbi:MAG: hypothetical protein RI894_2637 [Bacteroidota bacterium]|jgi:hypothetical protein
MRKLFRLFLQKLPARHREIDTNLHLLSQSELAAIYWTQWTSVLVATLLSVLGFVALYLPFYQFPEWFQTIELRVPYYGVYALPWVFNLYSLILMVAEIYTLTMLHIYTVYRLACITGYLTADDLRDDLNGDALRLTTVLDVGLEVKNKAQIEYGIDPFQGMSVSVIFLANSLLRLRGLLSSIVIKWVVGRWLGLSTLRAIMDFSVMPLYMLLNGYGTYLLLREARVVIMGQHLIERVLQAIDFPFFKNNYHADYLSEILYDTLQFVAVQKRDYHSNHYILAKLLLEKFDIQPRKTHILRENYLEILEKSPERLRNLCILILHLGFLLDGSFSFREKAKVVNMHRRGIITENVADVSSYLRSFLRGEGMTGLIEKYIKIHHT